MINHKTFKFPALLVAGGFAFITACSKPDSVGIEVLPESDFPGVIFTDTVSVEAYTIAEDSLRSDQNASAFNLAGSYTDPVFGLSRASFYSQVRLPNNNASFSFGTNPVLDSVVLTLAYADFYGDTLTPLFVEVFQVDQSLLIDSAYYTIDELLLGQQLFAETIEVRPKDSLFISAANRAPHLRLNLSSSPIGNDFITSPTTNFTNNESFLTFFKGIHVRTSDVLGAGQGCIMSFNLLASMTKLTFYYTNDADTSQQSANFEINTSCPRFNNYQHDYTTAEFGNLFPVAGDNKLYIQSMSGVKVRLNFPHLKNFSSQGAVSINKAELVIPATDNSTYKSHQNLLVFGVDEEGKEAIIPDLLESINYYGGAFSTTDNDYKFNIGRYVQQVISGRIENNFGLSLIAAGGAVNAFRTVIPGTASPGSKIQLRITYTKMN